eukprot:scaffold154375_cov33-Tisochrysis_lutea.AAC.2
MAWTETASAITMKIAPLKARLTKRALGGWFEEEAAIRPATRKRRVERMHEMFLLHLDLDEESTAGDAAGTAILPVAVGWHAR